MGLTAKNPGGTDYDPVALGVHQAICYGIYDLGTQYQERFGKSTHKVLFQWELPEERINIERDDKMVNLPRAISKQYTCSLHEKSNLRKDLQSWRGVAFTTKQLEGFDLKTVLGANCSLQVLHNTREDGRIFANVAAIIPLMKNMKKREPENPLRFFSFEDQTNIPEGTPDWIVDIIKAADEWGSGNSEPDDDAPYNEEDPDPIDDDEIPF